MNQSIIEKSRSHNDIFSTMEKTNQKFITKYKSKSFDITSLMKQSSSINNSANIGLLQGADISEPFADRLISTSVQSDLESMQSLEPELILNESTTPTSSVQQPPQVSPLTIKEPLNYVFNFSQQQQEDNDEYELESMFEIEDKPLDRSLSVEKEDSSPPPPIIPIESTYAELSKFRPHSLSTIPSSRASQYASSIDSDDVFEQDNQLNKDNYDDNYQYHMSDDDHGVIGSEFSSPRSRPLSSIQSRPLSPEQYQQIKSINFADIDNNVWEQSINNEPILSEDFNNLSSIIAVESFDCKSPHIIDEIEPILVFHDNNHNTNSFVEQTDQTIIHPLIQEDYITIEQEFDINLDPNDLADRLGQLDHSANKTLVHQQEEIINIHIFDKNEQNSKFNIENLTTIVDEIHQINQIKVSTEQLLLQQSLNNDSKQSLTAMKPPNHCKIQRIDKVSDLEIMKQGKGFKIGYIDRQGTDQRVILTKRIEAGPDIMERDPHIRLPYKGRRLLNHLFSSVLFTNGYSSLQEDGKFQHSTESIEVPIIGTNPKHFDESDMISIDIDGPSTMLNSICESIVITQGSVYSNNSLKSQLEKPISQSISNQYSEHLRASHPIKKDKVEVIDSWHDHTIINGSSTPWRSPFKPTKKTQSSVNTTSTYNLLSHDTKQSPTNTDKQIKLTHEIALSPIPIIIEKCYQTTATSPITFPQTVDRSSQYSPPMKSDQGLQCYFETITSYTQVSPYQIPGLLKTQDGIQTYNNNNSSQFHTLTTHGTKLERSADSGILVDDNHHIPPRKSNSSVQVDRKSSSSDSEDTSELTTRPIIRQTSPLINHTYDNSIIDNPSLNTSATEIEQEISQLCRERAHILDLLSLNWSRSNIWVELTEAKLNYIIGETDALLRALSFDSTSVDNETVKLKMQQYEEDMAALTRQHLVVYRERLEASKKQLDIKIDELELRKSSLENHPTNRISTYEHTPRLINIKRSKSFLSTSAENLTTQTNQEIIASHPQLLDVSFLTSKTSGLPSRFTDNRSNNNNHETIRTIHRPTPRYPMSNNPKYDYNNGNLSHMEGLSKSQQAILDETDKLVKDSQQLHTESASQFERARESLLSSETPIRLARANMAASRLESYSGKKTYLPNDVTLAELFKYEQSLAKETAKNTRQLYTKTTTKS
ncbi:unnamed protein product [Adineta steineri]|uniref:Uncharacterized protein n=1 Tax=Adineta steineri TaxID=433720 RepID=A0A815AEW4_9BILA|nr:unnamed protein product [Adineta steineri]